MKSTWQISRRFDRLTEVRTRSAADYSITATYQWCLTLLNSPGCQHYLPHGGEARQRPEDGLLPRSAPAGVAGGNSEVTKSGVI